VDLKDVVKFAMFFTLRESRRTPDPSFSRVRGSALQLHSFSLGSEALRLLQRWGLLVGWNTYFISISIRFAGIPCKRISKSMPKAGQSRPALTGKEYPVFQWRCRIIEKSRIPP